MEETMKFLRNDKQYRESNVESRRNSMCQEIMQDFNQGMRSGL